MPTLNITTNASIDRVESSDVVRELSKLTASLIGKPEMYVMVSLRPDIVMSFGGSEDPCAYCELVSLGSIGGEKNKTISAGICAFLQGRLQVPPNRTYIHFIDPQRSDFGFNSSTFG
jgi:phenylpyruvate tautomerase